jgi:surface polysaccharide O-acyltransferase-like enzyme
MPHRLAYIDNLRWSAISMVVVIHAAVTYSSFGDWYYFDRAPLSLAARVAFATYQSFQHAVAMGLLFGIAGFFAGGAVARKGVAGFLRERLQRLGLPLLFYLLVIDPIIGHFITGNWHATPRSFVDDWSMHMLDGKLLDRSGPLWFCFVLLIFSGLFAAFRALVPAEAAAQRGRVPGAPAVFATIATMAAATFAVGVAWPQNLVVANVNLHDFPQYPFMFAVGVMAQRQDWPGRIASRTGRWWLLGGLAGSLVLWIALIGLGGALSGHLRDYGGGWHWQAAGMDVWRSFTCLSLTLGLITLYRDRFNRTGPITRFLTRNAFGVYVFHAPILIAITVALHGWPVETGIKFALASLLGIACSFAFVGLIARRTPVLRTIL